MSIKRQRWVVAASVAVGVVTLAGVPLMAGQGRGATSTTTQQQKPPQSGTTQPGKPATPAASKPATPAGAVTPPDDYVIGPDDVIYIGLYRDVSKDMNQDVVVRPDGKISFPLINEVQAAGYTVEQFREVLTKEFAKFNDDPTVILAVKQINSRKVYICCAVGKPGPYPLMAHMTVVNLITVAGGLADFAHKDEILVIRHENGADRTVAKLNYEDYADGKAVAFKQNIELRPGDSVIVR